MAVDGYVSAIGAALLFGIQYVPVKKYETYDGSVFQFFLCCGALFAAFAIVLVRELVMYHTIPTLNIVSPGLLGGFFWAVSNAMVIPLVKMLGLGVGFSMYHVVNLVTGYCTGRFGLPFVGLAPDKAEHPGLRDGGVMLLVVSFALLVIVEPEEEKPPSLHCSSVQNNEQAANVEEGGGLQWNVDAAQLNGSIVSAAGSTDAVRRSMLRATSAASFGLPPKDEQAPQRRIARRLLGPFLALAAGVTCGLNAVPFTLWKTSQAEKGLSHDPVVYVLSQSLGVWFTSLFIYLLWSLGLKLVRRSKPLHSALRPALIAGFIWAAGNMLMLSGIDSLGLATGYALDAVGPVLVASVISAALGEIRGKKQLTIFGMAVGLESLGVIMVAVGNGKSN